MKTHVIRAPIMEELTLPQWVIGALIFTAMLSIMVASYSDQDETARHARRGASQSTVFDWFALAALAAVIMIAFYSISPALAHDSWINRGGFKSPAGEYCCGEGDCFAIAPRSVEMTAQGYRLFKVETVPFSEAQPSPDGAYWRCRRPDGTRRCFFAPPPGS